MDLAQGKMKNSDGLSECQSILYRYERLWDFDGFNLGANTEQC